MIRIGNFGKLTGLTNKALKYYESIGLMKPAKINEENGYRYYSGEQFEQVSQIMAMKNGGCKIKDICNGVYGDFTGEGLEKRIHEIDKEMEILKAQRQYMRLHKKLNGSTGKCIAVEKPVVGGWYASQEIECSSRKELLKKTRAMETALKRPEAEDERERFTFFEISGDGKIERGSRVKIYLPIERDEDDFAMEDKSGFECGVAVMHRGSYDEMPFAYEFAKEWISENGYEVTGAAREFYYGGGATGEAAELLIPVKEKKLEIKTGY